MARPATPEVKITEALTPVATPLGLYARPAQPEPSPLHGVAQALMSLSSDLSSWGNKQAAEQKEADFLRGQADFYSKTEQGYAEGVRSGEIPANASPGYAKGFNQAQGNAAGFSLESQFAASYEKWEGKNDSNPQAFEDWFRTQSVGSIKNNNPHFLKGITPHLQEIHNRYHDKWQRHAEQATRYQAISSYSASVAGAIDDTMVNWKADARAGNLKSPDLDTLAANIEVIRQRGYSIGMRADEIDKVVMDTVQAKTLQYRDPELLRIFDNKSSAGPRYKDTPYGMDAAAKTRQALMELWKKETTEERLKMEREDRLAANQAKASIVESILKDPKAPIDERLISTVTKVDGDFKMDIRQWQDKVLQSNTTDDPRKVNELFMDILSGGDGMDKLMSAIRAKDIQSQDSVTKALTFIKSMQDFSNSKSSILTTAAARMYITQMEEQGLDAKFSKNRILGAPPVLTPEARQALFNYRFGLMQWGIQNPNASVLDQEKEAATRGEEIFRNFKAPKPGKANAFTLPPTMQDIPQTPFTPENVGDAARKVLQQVVNPPPPQQPQPQPAPTPQAPPPQQQQGRPLPPDLQGTFTPDQISKAAAWGQKNGRTTEQVLRQMQKQFGGPQHVPQPVPGNSPAAPSAPAPGPRTEAPLPFSPTSYGAANIPPAAQAVIRQAADTLGIRLPGGTPASAEPPATTTTQQSNQGTPPSSARATRILNKPDIGPLVQQVAAANGMDPNELAVMVDIESSGRPGVSTGRYHGLLQLSQTEFSKFGGTDIFDPKENLEAGAKVILQKKARFEAEFGRPATITELYMMHQQGEAGMRAHVRNPDQAAWESMHSTGEGRQRGAGWAKQAIWLNVPDDMKGRFGSVDNINSREFLAIWTSKLLGISYDKALAMNSRNSGARADASQD